MDEQTLPDSVEGEHIPEIKHDDWGDFSNVLAQLEQQEKHEDSELDAETTTANIEANTESIEIILGGLFGMVEQVTGAMAGVKFQFDEQGKQDVIKAAIPVLEKRGDAALVKFLGDYAQEGALLIAVVMLLVGARSSIKHAKLEKRQSLEVDNGEKASADSV
ncbi:hypothetical protein [Vibrio scophthalmi]|uniref:Uncharacterized protein n=1 Tax=Vibrio scophthalmi TaxID=45658 RepID=A0A1E3WJ65_9VIBR|nr:hypothetical protein [Vibrio scophthalmi]ODS09813.1 hypothetical protein VSF3289_00044 [Vibrio scophthalmi]